MSAKKELAPARLPAQRGTLLGIHQFSDYVVSSRIRVHRYLDHGGDSLGPRGGSTTRFVPCVGGECSGLLRLQLQRDLVVDFRSLQYFEVELQARPVHLRSMQPLRYQ